MQAEEEAEMTSYHDKMWRDRISVMQYDSKVDDIDGIFAVCHRADTIYTFNIARHQYHAFIIIFFYINLSRWTLLLAATFIDQ